MPPTVRTFLVTIAVAVAVAPPLFADPPRPVGTWTREAAPLTFTVTFTETTLTARCVFDEGDGTDTVTLDAEYHVSSDGVLYGVVTGADARPLDLARDVQAIAGQPFALRCRVDGGVMHVREVKFLGVGVPGGGPRNDGIADLVAAVAGRYEASRPAAPKSAAKPAAPVVVAPRMVPPAAPPGDRGALPAYLIEQWEKDSGGITLPSPHYLKHQPQYFPPDPTFPPRPAEVAPAPRPVSRPHVGHAPSVDRIPSAANSLLFPLPTGLDWITGSSPTSCGPAAPQTGQQSGFCFGHVPFGGQ